MDTIIFDLGGVLIDWNPRHLYRKIFSNEDEMEWFLEKVCNSEWNVEQDAGRSFEDAVALLSDQFPKYKEQIEVYYSRWQEMLGGPIAETVTLLNDLKSNQELRLLALTNWSHQTFPIAQDRYPFLDLFEGILVSGVEKMKKPDHDIYKLLISRYELDPGRSVFIDDSLPNVEAAQELGVAGIHFKNTNQLKSELLPLIDG